MAISLGGTFVARSFSGDGKQLVPLLKAAISHRGVAVLDVISPCVTFNDHEGSTKSYEWVKEHEDAMQDPSFIPYYEEVLVDYEPGTTTDVRLHDGSHLMLRKLHEEEHDPTDRGAALRVIEEGRRTKQLVTGLLYVEPEAEDFSTREHLPERPLRDYAEDELRLTRAQFDEVMAEMA
jgi:2-oxoglutarate ferredoxin oxidoreductase subunit beta